MKKETAELTLEFTPAELETLNTAAATIGISTEELVQRVATILTTKLTA